MCSLLAAPGDLQAFAAAEIRPSALARDEAACFDRALWQRLAATGFFRTAATGELASAVAAVVELGRGGLDAPLGLSAVAQWVGIHLLSTFGSPEQRERYLEPLLSGQKLVAVCNSEAGTGTQLKGLRSAVIPDGNGSDGCRAWLAKSAATNLSQAEVLLVSAWKGAPDGAQSLEVFALPAEPGGPLVQEGHVDRLAGFRTGLTGALRCEAPFPISSVETQLGADGTGVRVLRLCFHLERLLIGALLGGILDGLYDACARHLQERAAADGQFAKNQYVQEKLVLLYTLARRTAGLLSLVEHGLSSAVSGATLEQLEPLSGLLAVLKLTAVEDSLLAAGTAYELHGYGGYGRVTFIQKAQRDLLAFKMLGGSKEQMKMALFRDLTRGWTQQSS